MRYVQINLERERKSEIQKVDTWRKINKKEREKERDRESEREERESERKML